MTQQLMFYTKKEYPVCTALFQIHIARVQSQTHESVQTENRFTGNFILCNLKQIPEVPKSHSTWDFSFLGHSFKMKGLYMFLVHFFPVLSGGFFCSLKSLVDLNRLRLINIRVQKDLCDIISPFNTASSPKLFFSAANFTVCS